MADVRLTERDYQKINEQLQALAGVQRDIAIAKQGGIQCDEHDAACQFLMKAYADLKQAYFRDRP